VRFKEGDAVVHPARGAGIVTDVLTRKVSQGTAQYYRIKLLDGSGTRVMLPAKAVGTLGVRPAIQESGLGRVWGVLTSEASGLPTDHKERYAVLEEKLGAGDVLQTAEVVRDLAGRQRIEGRLTTVGKRFYERAMTFLVGEIAAAQSVELPDAEDQVRARLQPDASPTVDQ
jgi:RNA polymerase-interacting CarD/CdnL/TRCF family regulator